VVQCKLEGADFKVLAMWRTGKHAPMPVQLTMEQKMKDELVVGMVSGFGRVLQGDRESWRSAVTVTIKNASLEAVNWTMDKLFALYSSVHVADTITSILSTTGVLHLLGREEDLDAVRTNSATIATQSLRVQANRVFVSSTRKVCIHSSTYQMRNGLYRCDACGWFTGKY
jgi:hypothetical protein